MRRRGRRRAAPACAAAIFDYNHATWYVNEVLALAAEYAAGLPLTAAELPARRPGWMGMPRYDAFLLVSFGGPEGPDDVIPFLRERHPRAAACRGSGWTQVAEHYYRFGGVSPINQQCRDLLAAIEKDFAASGIDLPVYWGNRNWDPLPGRHGGARWPPTAGGTRSRS